MFNIVEFPSAMAPEAEGAASMFCKDEAPFAPLCGNLVFALVGKNPEQFNGVSICHNLNSFTLRI